jgi:DNA-binding transcriptional MerR regulator
MVKRMMGDMLERRTNLEEAGAQAADRRNATDAADTTPKGAQPVAAVMRIEEVSRRTGLSKRTLRYYEKLGLLEPAPRSDGNYRMYRLEDVTTLERIKELRDLLGLELSEIRQYVGYEIERERRRSQWRQDENPEARLDLLAKGEQMTHEQLRLIETRVAELNQLAQSLRERLESYERARAEILGQAKPEARS